MGNLSTYSIPDIIFS
jgi:hypothetical protein